MFCCFVLQHLRMLIVKYFLLFHQKNMTSFKHRKISYAGNRSEAEKSTNYCFKLDISTSVGYLLFSYSYYYYCVEI